MRKAKIIVLYTVLESALKKDYEEIRNERYILFKNKKNKLVKLFQSISFVLYYQLKTFVVLYHFILVYKFIKREW